MVPRQCPSSLVAGAQRRRVCHVVPGTHLPCLASDASQSSVPSNLMTIPDQAVRPMRNGSCLPRVIRPKRLQQRATVCISTSLFHPIANASGGRGGENVSGLVARRYQYRSLPRAKSIIMPPGGITQVCNDPRRPATEARESVMTRSSQ